MNEHEVFQGDLPPYAAGRLEGAAAERLEAHLRECESCREMMDTFKEFASALREGGEALFEPHPAESALKGYARDEASAERGRIERHLEVCATCSLEVETWKRHGDRAGDGAVPTSDTPRRWRAVALASAAGLVIGFTLARLLSDASAPPIPAPPGPRIAEPTAGALLVLPRALRGEGTTVSYRIEPQQDLVVIACFVSIPDQAAPDDRFRYEIRKSGGEVVWFHEMRVAAIRAQLDSPAEAVTLLAPTASLAPGKYVFSLSPSDRPDEALYRADLEVAGTP